MKDAAAFIRVRDALERLVGEFEWGRAWYSTNQSDENAKKVRKSLENARAALRETTEEPAPSAPEENK